MALYSWFSHVCLIAAAGCGAQRPAIAHGAPDIEAESSTPAVANDFVIAPAQKASICVGTKPPADTRQRRTSCCLPTREALRKPIDDARNALRTCFESRTNAEAAGRVLFDFRIEQDGSIAEVCSGVATEFDDEGALRCMLEVVHKVRYPQMSDDSRALCGLMTLHYPVTFVATPN